MYIDERLKWDEHIKQLSTKLSKNIGLLLRLKLYLTTKLLDLVYNSLILPYLAYCNLITSCASPSTIKKIGNIAKKAIRIINKTGYRDHTTPLFKKLGCLRLRIFIDRKYSFLCINLVANSSLITSLVTSMSHLQFILILRETLMVISFLLLIQISDKNVLDILAPAVEPTRLPCDIKQAVSLPIFKSKLKKLLLNEYIYYFFFITY